MAQTNPWALGLPELGLSWRWYRALWALYQPDTGTAQYNNKGSDIYGLTVMLSRMRLWPNLKLNNNDNVQAGNGTIVLLRQKKHVHLYFLITVRYQCIVILTSLPTCGGQYYALMVYEVLIASQNQDARRRIIHTILSNVSATVQVQYGVISTIVA